MNDAVPKDTYMGEPLKLRLPTVDSLITIIKYLGAGCLLFKRDLKKAYRQIPVDPGDTRPGILLQRSHLF